MWVREGVLQLTVGEHLSPIRALRGPAAHLFGPGIRRWWGLVGLYHESEGPGLAYVVGWVRG